MKLLWLRKRFSSFIETVETYPIVTICLSILSMLVVFLIRYGNSMDNELLETVSKIVMVWFIAVCLFAIVTKISQWWWKKWWVMQSIALLWVVLYYIFLPWFLDNISASWIIQHIIVQLCVVLWLLIVPLLLVKRWNNSLYGSILHLLLHIALAVISVWLLASWVSVALLWIETLFEVNIAGEWYGTIFAVMWILLWWLAITDGYRTWNVANSDIQWKQMKWQLMFGWVIWVLLCIYAAILYVYLWKIIFTWVWPSGEVTIWSFVFSMLVIVWSIVLVPLISSENNFRTCCLNCMYASLLPVCAMVVCAIYQRIAQYGLTEGRYIVVLILVWLVCSSVYVLSSKKKDLRAVSAILLICWIIAAFWGPVSARVMSYKNQLWWLKNIISQHNLADESWVLLKKSIADLDKETQKLVAWKITYIADYHWVDLLSEITWSKENSWYKQVQELWLQDVQWWWEYTKRQYYSVEYEVNSVVKVAWYTSYYKSLSNSLYSYSGTIVTIDESLWNITFDIAELLPALEKTDPFKEVPKEMLVLEVDNALVLFDYLGLEEKENWSKEIYALWFDLLIK